MSKGWESKSVEAQQDLAEQAAVETKSVPTAAKEKIARDSPEAHAEAARQRKRQELELQRERILSERTASPHRRSALALALADIEEKITQLGFAIHM